MKKEVTAEFSRFCTPILQTLKDVGGAGNVAEVTDTVLLKMKIPESEQAVILKNGQSRVRNQVQWARFYMSQAGYLDASQRGIWSLTEKGRTVDLSSFDVSTAIREVRSRFSGSRKKRGEPKISEDELDEVAVEETNYKAELLSTLKSLPPTGFERLCQRLLLESGFQQVNITGRSGDGGIDGNGVLAVNPFVSFNVLFQCKRYEGAVSPSQVRDFRGAMEGRADKGIIITTGTFTLDAKKEARRDGAKPIELVDGEKLVEMFEQLELGLIPRRAFAVNHDFFDDFRRQ